MYGHKKKRKKIPKRMKAIDTKKIEPTNNKLIINIKQKITNKKKKTWTKQ